ncbi:MAG: bifunctional 5,10-methylene-tetrahydrofolate dehydrogenase:5,10-methylene-tetrahydrofolate [Deltaproteobacteria bacterium]|nr:bifunctional 5,10-methylene-tetrahydrofolate dehydrogenase:5,10-methylene-tetrahydrofolate [Deltaproteobacteria bacterium]
MTILVLARTVDPHRQAEALRAALGLTLRGAHVEVFIDGPLLTPLAERAAATLRSFGHTVSSPPASPGTIGGELGPALARADVVEVWT